jgi:hypothetical protein
MAGWLGGMMQRAAQNNPQMAEMMANRERRIGEIRSRIAPWMQEGGGPLGVMKAIRNASAPVSQDAQNYFNSQSADDQNTIRQSWGGKNQMQQWYDNAKAAGSVPATQPATQPASAPATAGQSPGWGQPAPQGGGFQEKLADVVSGGFSDPYEAQKQARLGPRQRMM